MSGYRYIGGDTIRVDGREKVTGQTRYGADLKIANMHYGKILFSPYPRARVLKIDTAQATALPGVRAVLTHRDIKGQNRFGYEFEDQPLLVPEGGVTGYIGDAIAFVVATTEKVAEQACQLIKVEYEELPPIISIEAAAAAEPLVRDSAPGNVCVKKALQWGDTAAGFAQCRFIVEATYSTPRQEHAFLEPEAGVAYVDDQGVLHVRASLQYPGVIVKDIGHALGVPLNRIHVQGTPAGGGFGGKLDTGMQLHLAAMAYLSGLPVKLVFSREESFRFHHKRHPFEIRVKIGADAAGNLLALEAELATDAGPYSGRTPEVTGLATNCMPWPYRIANVDSKGIAYYTNNPPSGAFRGFGAPQAAVAREMTLDKLARVMGMDPLALRRQNFLREESKPASQLLGEVSLETLRSAMLAKLGDPPRPSAAGRVVGRGYSFDMPVFCISAMPYTGKAGVGATAEVYADGTAAVFCGGTELGQGISTLLAQVVAEELGIAPSAVRVKMADTETNPRAGRTSASRLTFNCCNALLLALKPIKERLLERAGRHLGLAPAELVLADGLAQSLDGSKAVPLAQVASMCFNEGIKLREEGWYKYQGQEVGYGHTFMACGADVEVDPATGRVEILKLVSVHDTGQAINAAALRGQLIGGAIQALGFCLMEDMVAAGGQLKTRNLAEYIIPTALDIPAAMLTESIENPYPGGPYGAKGAGEHALNAAAPAILNAITQATGLAFTSLPVLPEHLLARQSERGGNC